MGSDRTGSSSDSSFVRAYCIFVAVEIITSCFIFLVLEGESKHSACLFTLNDHANGTSEYPNSLLDTHHVLYVMM